MQRKSSTKCVVNNFKAAMNKTIDIFATQGELADIVSETASLLGYLMTFIDWEAKTTPFTTKQWRKVQDSLRGSASDQMDVVLTPAAPKLKNVDSFYTFLEMNQDSGNCILFRFGRADDSVVLVSNIEAYFSPGTNDAKIIGNVVRRIRNNAMRGFWIFNHDMTERAFRTTHFRYTSGAKALQDAGALVSDYRDEPNYILGEVCPYPYSKARVV